MFKFLKSLFLNKNYLQKTTEDIIFDIAQINDIEKIKDFIFCGAREGHFNKGYLEKNAAGGLLDQLKKTIVDNYMPITNYEAIPAYLYILKKNSKIIAFSWIRYKDEYKAWEIYLLYLDVAERKKGYGEDLLIKTINKIKSKNIYVDLLEESKVMEQLLLRNNFRRDGSNFGGNKRFKLQYK